MRPDLNQELMRRILILDGAMGTMIQQTGLTAQDFGGPEYEGCNEILNVTKPEVISRIHESYLEAGADIIETNSFGATRTVLAEYGLADQDIELNREGARLAREAADRYSTADKYRFVAGSMGPTTKMLSLTGGITYEELEEDYRRQVIGLLEGGVDLLLVETSSDTLNVKAAGTGIAKAFEEFGREIPVMISCTIEPSGTMLAGQNIEAFYISIQHLNPVSVGLNCGTGAELMNDHLRTLESIAACAVSCHPNAGLPDEEGIYRETPEEFAGKMKRYAANGWLNITGGCCGTTAEHIRVLAEALKDIQPRTRIVESKSALSGIEAVWVEEDNRPLLVGERSNVIGSRLFRDLIADEKFEEGSEIARNQARKGAGVIDICVANPDRDELEDMVSFLPYVVKKVKAPLMLDSTDPAVLEAGLKLTQGKAVINSINLENGLERFEEVVPLIKKYGAAVVVGVIDEQGMALTRERKLAVAERSYDLLVNRYGIPPVDIIFDPLTFPVGTGDTKYLGSAAETIEGLRLIKQKMPLCKTVLGISNVSFGLPPAGREVLNAVFVYLNTLAGLDYAIVNAEKMQRYPTIPEEERKLAQDLLLNTNDETLRKFTEFYREKKVSEVQNKSTLSLEERLAGYIVEGSKDGLEKDLQEALVKYTPLDIINGPLMQGMEEVGRLFNENQLIVAEVLQSAEVMKAAVTILEPHMERAEEAVKGKILLATVKGDVHDIGKNLVEIILTNNGYNVINLGVKVDSDQLIAKSREEKPDAIGLSGLLVKSVQQMLLTAQDLRDQNIDIPLILGGAALSRKYTEEKIAPVYGGPVLYARDAMDSLKLLSDVIGSRKIAASGEGSPSKDNVYPSKDNVYPSKDSIYPSPGVGPQSKQNAQINQNAQKDSSQPPDEISRNQRSQVSHNFPVYHPPSLERKVIRDYPINDLLPYLNIPLLMRRYLGVGKVPKKAAAEEVKAMERYRDRDAEFEAFVHDFLDEIQKNKLIRANGIYQFFPAQAKGNSVYIYDSPQAKSTLEQFVFPRQQKEPFLCAADYIRPVSKKEMDYLGMFAVTAGEGVREQAESLRSKGDYLKSYLLQVLALELVEAFAESIHEEIRSVWGLPNVKAEKGSKKNSYQGIRISPGYPVCPDIEDQKKVFRLLKPEEVGIILTEGMMMDPEASITALVFSHTEAVIFPV